MTGCLGIGNMNHPLFKSPNDQVTPWKFKHNLPLKLSHPKRKKESNLPVLSFFRGELLNFGGVILDIVNIWEVTNFSGPIMIKQINITC